MKVADMPFYPGGNSNPVLHVWSLLEQGLGTFWKYLFLLQYKLLLNFGLHSTGSI